MATIDYCSEEGANVAKKVKPREIIEQIHNRLKKSEAT